MSFSPLPEILIRDLTANSARPVLDLGCGEGRLKGRLRALGCDVLGLDIARGLGRAPDIVGDAQSPPFRPQSVGVCVAGNFLRHCFDPSIVLDVWRTLVDSAGSLWILEDEPSRDGQPGEVYRDLQRLLHQVSSGRRGDLLPLHKFQQYLTDAADWMFGTLENHERMGDPTSLLAWLEGASGSRDAADLARRIRSEGLCYGRYWWARWSPGKAA